MLRSLQTLVTIYLLTQCNILEDMHLNTFQVYRLLCAVRQVSEKMKDTAYTIFIYAIFERKCRNVLSMLLSNVCSNKFDVAYCFVLSRWFVLTDFISAITHSHQQFTDSFSALKIYSDIVDYNYLITSPAELLQLHTYCVFL